MHDTLNVDVLGMIDNYNVIDNQTIFVNGWCFHKKQCILPLRIVNESGTSLHPMNIVERKDVRDYYKDSYINILKSGWDATIDRNTNYYLEMLINNEWIPIFYIKNDLFQNTTPSFVVVDNFYKNPDNIREYAMRQDFQPNIEYHKGKRALSSSFRFPGLKEKFEKILRRTITNWENYNTNGCFQYCVAEDKSVYHCDSQQYAGIIYLSPDCPPQTGTCFYRSKHTKKMKVSSEEHGTVFKHGYYDSTEFELVDVVGNVYNRLILFDAKMIHAAPTYFGDNLQNGRLFQLFFFDLEDE
jgi:hypothetical protein